MGKIGKAECMVDKKEVDNTGVSSHSRPDSTLMNTSFCASIISISSFRRNVNIVDLFFSLHAYSKLLLF